MLSFEARAVVLIAFSSSPLTISPSDRELGERGLILPCFLGWITARVRHKTRPCSKFVGQKVLVKLNTTKVV